MKADFVIRGGTVIDGSGEPARTADVAITDGVIVEVGSVETRGRREINVEGALVTPGFVDIHTHYDGQATWDSRLQPSSAHGVTTVVMGNCGVGFAPVKASHHNQLIELMEGVEDLPGPVLHEGLRWTWESFDEYLGALDRPHDIDLASQIPHAALRIHVMGQRGADREPATADDIAEMGRLAAAGIAAGALGFSTSRTLNHKTSHGELIGSLTASREELVGIAQAVGATGTGVFQVVSDLTDFDDEMATFRAMMRASGRPLSLSLMQRDASDDYRRALHAIEDVNAQGLQMTAVVAPRAIGVLIALDGSVCPWTSSPTFGSSPDLTDPVVKQRILAEVADHGGVWLPLERVYELGDPPDYEPSAASSVAARAQREGRRAEDLLYDILLNGPAYWPAMNYFDGNLDAVREMLAHRHSVPGLGDGGAHVGIICDASFPTTLLTHWGRDRQHGRFSLPWLVHRQCRATATMVGLRDRGLLLPGLKADVNVIDFDALTARPPHIVADLPAGGRRVMQAADGYLHTLVNGVEVYTNGKPTGALPGRLIRGARKVA
jgi:N-acyl-D-aspartate/D-glutamate deacylase